MRRALLLAVSLAALAGCVRDPGTAFEADHVDSRPHPAGFVEVFRVTVLRAALATDAVTFVLDGGTINVSWQDDDGAVDEGDRFSFVADAFDRPRRIEASLEGRLLWSAEYRGGAGEPV